MRMGMARITRMGALCVRKGVLGDREKDPKKWGVRGIERSRLKEWCQRKKKIKKSFKNFYCEILMKLFRRSLFWFCFVRFLIYNW